MKNILTIQHQDGDVRCKVTKAGYCITKGCITISIETEPFEEYSFPRYALLSLVNYPLPDGVLQVGSEFSFADDHVNGWEISSPHANAYFGFHAQEVSIVVTVRKMVRNRLSVSLEAITDDVNYYDHRAKKNRMIGTFELTPKHMDDLWIPE